MSRPAGAGRVEDNSLGRLLTLADGVFAIAMTLLALDLKVPNLGAHPGNHALGHALAANADSYWSFLLTFYVVARYWGRHRQLMRWAVRAHAAVVRDTLVLLLLVAAMPFPASLLGRYGGNAVSLLLYGAINALATLTLMVMSRDVQRLRLADREPSGDEDYAHSRQAWLSLVTFILCMPAGYVLGSGGPFVFLLLAVPERVSLGRWLWRTARRRATDGDDRPS